MKPFDLEKAKAGKPICTREGKDARLIYDDAIGKFPVIALVKEKAKCEIPKSYTLEGLWQENRESPLDLFMKVEHNEGYINIVFDKYTKKVVADLSIYDSEAEARRLKYDPKLVRYIATVKIEWED